MNKRVQVGKCLVNTFNKEVAFKLVRDAKAYYEVECDDANSVEAKFNSDLNACDTLEEVADVLNYYEAAIYDQGAFYYIEEVVYMNGVRIA